MIRGIGVDLVNVERIRRALDNPKTGERFRDRVFTHSEIEYCEGRRGKYQSYAARFAAKEAVMKALGRGWSEKVSWQEIEVVRRPGGKPDIQLHGRTQGTATERRVKQFQLSITHTEDHAIAYVIAEGD